MDGQWDCERLDELACRLAAHRCRPTASAVLAGSLAQLLRHGVLNLQSVARAFEVGEQHYDVGRRSLPPCSTAA